MQVHLPMEPSLSKVGQNLANRNLVAVNSIFAELQQMLNAQEAID